MVILRVLVGHLGSSPLARGLRAPRDHAAGKRMDHPRSRGVYAEPA